MIYVECPNRTDSNKKSLFLAGGISGCKNWSKIVVSKLYPLDIVIYNPRRESFDKDNPSMTKEQITWEEEMIRKADVISFYFCRETLCPIALYELGGCNMTKKPLIVGMDTDYSRREDVEIQTQLKRPDVPIVYSIVDLVKEIKKVF
jgi:hypothetical protein